MSCPSGARQKSGRLLQVERALREPSDARRDLVVGLRPDEGSALGIDAAVRWHQVSHVKQ